MKDVLSLQQGDYIGIFSPSSPITATCPKRFKRSKFFLENKGFNIIEGNLTGKYDYYRSGSIKARVNELNSLIKNPNIKCIMSTIGGMNSNSLLPYIDYEFFKKNPKIIIGYSDVTALLLGIYAKTGIITYYGPALVASFGELEPFVSVTYNYFKDTIVDKNERKFPYKIENPKFWTDEMIDWEKQNRSKKCFENKLITVYPGKVKGRLIGGNLNTIQGIWGSEYMPEIKKGDILFIEDSLKDAQTIERSFAFLKLCGVFDKISGVILGKHELFDDLGCKKRPYEILLEILDNKKIPFLADFDCCHTHPMITLPIGGEIELDATNQSVTLLKY